MFKLECEQTVCWTSIKKPKQILYSFNNTQYASGTLSLVKLHNLIPYDIPQYDFRAISESNTGNLTGWFICNDTTPTTEAIYHSMIQKRTVKCDRPTYLTGPRATTKVKPKVTCMWSRHKPGTSKMQVTYLNVCYIAHVQSWLCF